MELQNFIIGGTLLYDYFPVPGATKSFDRIKIVAGVAAMRKTNKNRIHGGWLL